MQLATLIGTVLATALMLQLQVPSTYASTQAPPELCRLPAVCATRSPRVCGRDANGMCRRFNNICEMLEINRRDVSSSRKQTWTHTLERDCRRVRGVGVRHAYWCHQDCPRRPVACRRTSSSHEICVRSRNHRVCKILANRCQLLNNNCHARPRNNWLPADRRRCGQMQLGDKPNACLPLPTTRKPEVTIRPILPPAPEILTTTELPKTTTRRSTPGNGTTTVG